MPSVPSGGLSRFRELLQPWLPDDELTALAERLERNPDIAVVIEEAASRARNIEELLATVTARLERERPFTDPNLSAVLHGLKQALSAPALRESEVKYTPARPAGEASSPTFATLDSGERTAEPLLTPLAMPDGWSGSGPESFPRPFGRYQIEGKLGEGGMGAVFLATDTILGRAVALKIPWLRPDQARPILERFRREARAAAALEHPNICAVYDVGEHTGQPYMAMAYVCGRPLSELLKTPDEIPVSFVLELVHKLACTLQFAHERGVIHRDLKPANIMLHERGEPVVMDFGLARRDDGNDAELTQTGQIMGTPAYMSPEQIAGHRDAIGPHADVYSLGVVLYQLLTKRLPFESTGDLIALLGRIATETPPPPSTHRPAIDPTLDRLVLTALEKRPEHRYSSMAALAEAIADYRRMTQVGQATTLIAPEPTAPSKPAPRKRGVGIAVGAGALALVALVALVAVMFDIPFDRGEAPAKAPIPNDKPVVATAAEEAAPTPRDDDGDVAADAELATDASVALPRDATSAAPAKDHRASPLAPTPTSQVNDKPDASAPRGGGVRLAFIAPREGLAPPASYPSAGPEGWIDLMPQVGDPISEGWTLIADRLQSDPRQLMRPMNLGVMGARNYSFRSRFSLTEGFDAIHWLLPLDRNMFIFSINSYPHGARRLAGVQPIDRMSIPNNASRFEHDALVPGEEHEFHIDVRVDAEQVELKSMLDGELFSQWTGRLSSLGVGGFVIEDLVWREQPGGVAVATWGAQYTIHSAAWRPHE